MLHDGPQVEQSSGPRHGVVAPVRWEIMDSTMRAKQEEPTSVRHPPGNTFIPLTKGELKHHPAVQISPSFGCNKSA